MNKHKISIFLLLGFIMQTMLCSAQTDTTKVKPLSPGEKYKIEYQKRIKKKYLYSKYIPIDILEACRELSRLSDPLAIEKFKNNPEDSMVQKLHFGLGKWIQHNWGFEGGSRYSHYLKSMGLSYPDDMVRLTLIAWHRTLNEEDLELKPEVDAMVKSRKETWDERKKNRKVIKLGPKKKE